jgi:hypothetical protein
MGRGSVLITSARTCASEIARSQLHAVQPERVPRLAQHDGVGNAVATVPARLLHPERAHQQARRARLPPRAIVCTQQRLDRAVAPDVQVQVRTAGSSMGDSSSVSASGTRVCPFQRCPPPLTLAHHPAAAALAVKVAAVALTRARTCRRSGRSRRARRGS